MSKDFDQYLILKRFWTNLGLSYNEILKLKRYDFEVLNSIMMLETQNEEKMINKHQINKNVRR